MAEPARTSTDGETPLLRVRELAKPEVKAKEEFVIPRWCSRMPNSV